jgi:indoleamine 2,3-dioxygenase
MLDFPKIDLADFGVSVQNGFLPTEQPLRRLSDPYYRPWEDIMSDLPDLIATGEIRQKVLDLPILSTDRLHAETEWKRSYLVLALLTHAYIWGGKNPEDVCDLHGESLSYLCSF